MHFHEYKCGTTLQELDSDHPAAAGSSTILLQLTAGQKVSILNVKATQILGGNQDGEVWSWFSGVLLHQ